MINATEELTGCRVLLGNRYFTADCFRARTAAEEPGGGGGLGAGEQSPAPAVWRKSRGANSSGRGGVSGNDSWERARREEPKKPHAGRGNLQPNLPGLVGSGGRRAPAQAPRGKLNLSRQRPGPGSHPPPSLSAGPGPPHPPAPTAPAPLRAAPHLTAPAPLPAGRCPTPAPAPRRPPPQDAGSPAARSRRLPLEGGAGGAGRSGAEPGPPGALSEPPALPGGSGRAGGGAAPRGRRVLQEVQGLA